MQSIIQQIFRYGFQSYATVHRLPVHIYKAAASIIQCRTAALGGHIQGCPDGHMQRHWYNSCKHRICPQCAYTQVERWLARQRARLLNCAHFHVIFTMPHGLNTFWRYNRRLMSDFLFRSATETLTELMASAKWLGARPGIIAAQHSWTRTLLLHPHLHCLVTAGGLTDGKWVDSSERFLIPFRVVRA